MDDYDEKFLAYINGPATLLSTEINSGYKTIIVIGPEGGFKEEEAEILMAASYKAVSLGD